MSFSPKLRSQENLLPILILLLGTLLTYGILIPRLGFYRDDWYMLWTAQAQGTEGIMALFKIDRPFVGLLYAWDYLLLGKTPLHWHLYALLIKFLGILAVYWLTRLLWPEKNLAATFVALLFAVYPGFYQQPNAALFINLLLSQTAGMFSLAFTIQAARARHLLPNLLYTTLALLLAVFYLAIYEAMIGLEAARLLLLFYLVSRDSGIFHSLKTNLLTTLKKAMPYLLLGLGFAYWRVFLFNSTRHSTNVDALLGEYSATPLHSALAIAFEGLKDLFDTTLFAWTVPLYQFFLTSTYRDLGASLLLALLMAGITTAYFLWARQHIPVEKPGQPPDRAALHMAVLGALIIIITTIPIVAAGRNVVFDYQWDRYTVQSMLGVAFFLSGLAFYAVRPPLRWLLLFSLLASGVMTQYHSGVFYREFWQQEREIWWQLSWRAPDLQAGTTVIAALPPDYRLAEEYEVWGPLNITYNPAAPLKFTGQVLFNDLGFALQKGDLDERHMRSVLVPRDYSKPLVISKPFENACLHVIDGARLELPFIEDPLVRDIASYSRVDLILTEAAPHTPPAEVFGAEPEHRWCYYYQKISLARQRGDWDEAARLADEAEKLELKPADRSEWLPVIETYLQVGETQKATQVAKKIKADKNLRLTLCKQLSTWPASAHPEALIQILCSSAN
ncbi:MAG: hypothetical protein Fur0043_11140 [Anaerolineales bacterium]